VESGPFGEQIALSFDGHSSPSAALRDEAADQPNLLPSRWGLAWYPGSQRSLSVLRSADLPDGVALAHHLGGRSDLRSCTFLLQSHGFDPRVDPADVQPFERAYAGRQWAFTCSGTLSAGLRRSLLLDDAFDIAPIGDNAIEHAFCWLLARLRERGCKTIEEFGWDELRGLLDRVNEHGAASFILSDGIDLVAYRDARDRVPLHWTRMKPPHEATRLRGRSISIDFDRPTDAARTLFAVSTWPLAGARWTPMEPGELRVVRRGASVWSSHPVSMDEHVFGVVSAGHGVGAASGAARGETPVRVTDRSDCAPQQSGAAVAALPRSAPLPECATLSVLHRTSYRYEEPVVQSSHRFCLTPVRDERQEIVSHSMTISVDGARRDFEDVFGNRTTLLEVTSPYDAMTIESRTLLRVQGVRPADLKSPHAHDHIPLVWMPWQRQMMAAYLMPTELPEPELRELSEFAMSFVERCDYDLVETLLDLNRTIYRDFTYVPGSTTIETTPFEVYAQRRGVCQDFTNVFICVARLLGVPARYRVGYIYTGAGYENQIQSDASHAWAEVYLPWVGWFGFDPTNGCLTGVDHVRVACGRHFRDATPTSGTIYRGGGFETLSVDVQVERIEPEPGTEPPAPWSI